MIGYACWAQALRLSLVLELLWWCGEEGITPPPAEISTPAFAAAAELIANYFMPTASRVYGDAAATERERAATQLARWVIGTHPAELHVRHLQRQVRLPRLRSADESRVAATVLPPRNSEPPLGYRSLLLPPEGAGASKGRFRRHGHQAVAAD